MELWQTLVQLGEVLLKLAGELIQVGLAWSLVIAWVAWWLWAVNWRRAGPVLAQGAWAPLVLLMLTAALAWSQMSPSDYHLWFLTVPNFWWQLGAVTLLVGLTLFAGWLQGVMAWEPAEVSLEPPAPAGHHGHDAHH
jgi:hypothetical protein